MAEVHGRQSGVLADEFDVSSHVTQATLSGSQQSIAVTPIGSDDMTYIAGNWSGSISVSGTWQDIAAQDAFAAANLGENVVFTAAPEGLATAGLPCWLMYALETDYQTRSTATDAVRFTVSGTGQRGRAGGQLVHPHESASVGDTASVDGSASTPNGGIAHLHISEFTGTNITVTVEDSANDSTWATLATFTTATGVGAEHITFTGTVDRYVRVSVAGTFTTATIAVAVARNRA